MPRTPAAAFRKAFAARVPSVLVAAWTVLLPALAHAGATAPPAAGADPFPPDVAARGGVGILNIIFMAFAVYLVWRMVSNMRQRGKDDDHTTPTSMNSHDDDPDGTPPVNGTPPEDRREANAKAAWEHLSRSPERPAAPRAAPPSGPQSAQDGQAIPLPDGAAARDQDPAGFNHTEFVRGAKAIYARIRDSWAKRDLEDLRQFSSPDMMAQFEHWAAESPAHTEITIMLVDANVLEVKTEGTVTRVDVAYQATISDSPTSRESRQVKEVWSFSEDTSLRDATWLLEKMEQSQ